MVRRSKQHVTGRRRAGPVKAHNSTPRTMHDGRSKYPIIEPLREYMRAWGLGVEGDLAREEFAQRIGTSVQYLHQLGLGYRQASLELALAIDKHSHGLVPAVRIRPDIDWAHVRSLAARIVPVAVPPPRARAKTVRPARTRATA